MNFAAIISAEVGAGIGLIVVLALIWLFSRGD